MLPLLDHIPVPACRSVFFQYRFSLPPIHRIWFFLTLSSHCAILREPIPIHLNHFSVGFIGARFGVHILHLFAVPTLAVTSTFLFRRAIFLDLSQAED